jgi:hypothetical protein
MGCDAAGPLATEVIVLLLRVARIESAHKHVERRSNVAASESLKDARNVPVVEQIQIRESGRFSSFRNTNQFLGGQLRKALAFFLSRSILPQLWGEIQGINTSRCAARL